jgi:PHD/YefM family antitoxin component YafN of YafNO toxin-antitoxin module
MEDTIKEQILSISEVQKEITRLPDQFDNELQVVTVTRYGKPVMTILAAHTYKALQKTIEKLQEEVDGLLETLEILKDEETMAAFRQGVKEMEEGKGKLLDDVLKELGWE